jgi:hypothetical protein
VSLKNVKAAIILLSTIFFVFTSPNKSIRQQEHSIIYFLQKHKKVNLFNQQGSRLMHSNLKSCSTFGPDLNTQYMIHTELVFKTDLVPSRRIVKKSIYKCTRRGPRDKTDSPRAAASQALTLCRRWTLHSVRGVFVRYTKINRGCSFNLSLSDSLASTHSREQEECCVLHPMHVCERSRSW